MDQTDLLRLALECFWEGNNVEKGINALHACAVRIREDFDKNKGSNCTPDLLAAINNVGGLTVDAYVLFTEEN